MAEPGDRALDELYRQHAELQAENERLRKVNDGLRASLRKMRAEGEERLALRRVDYTPDNSPPIPLDDEPAFDDQEAKP